MVKQNSILISLFSAVLMLCFAFMFAACNSQQKENNEQSYEEQIYVNGASYFKKVVGVTLPKPEGAVYSRWSMSESCFQLIVDFDYLNANLAPKAFDEYVACFDQAFGDVQKEETSHEEENLQNSYNKVKYFLSNDTTIQINHRIGFYDIWIEANYDEADFGIDQAAQTLFNKRFGFDFSECLTNLYGVSQWGGNYYKINKKLSATFGEGKDSNEQKYNELKAFFDENLNGSWQAYEPAINNYKTTMVYNDDSDGQQIIIVYDSYLKSLYFDVNYIGTIRIATFDQVLTQLPVSLGNDFYNYQDKDVIVWDCELPLVSDEDVKVSFSCREFTEETYNNLEEYLNGSIYGHYQTKEVNNGVIHAVWVPLEDEELHILWNPTFRGFEIQVIYN